MKFITEGKQLKEQIGQVLVSNKDNVTRVQVLRVIDFITNYIPGIVCARDEISKFEIESIKDGVITLDISYTNTDEKDRVVYSQTSKGDVFYVNHIESEDEELKKHNIEWLNIIDIFKELDELDPEKYTYESNVNKNEFIKYISSVSSKDGENEYEVVFTFNDNGEIELDETKYYKYESNEFIPMSQSEIQELENESKTHADYLEAKECIKNKKEKCDMCKCDKNTNCVGDKKVDHYYPDRCVLRVEAESIEMRTKMINNKILDLQDLLSTVLDDSLESQFISETLNEIRIHCIKLKEDAIDVIDKEVDRLK